jgi:hypothetical protein
MRSDHERKQNFGRTSETIYLTMQIISISLALQLIKNPHEILEVNIRTIRTRWRDQPSSLQPVSLLFYQVSVDKTHYSTIHQNAGKSLRPDSLKALSLSSSLQCLHRSPAELESHGLSPPLTKVPDATSLQFSWYGMAFLPLCAKVA